MKPAALVYLRDDPAAQRLVVAWPLVTQRDGKQAALLDEWSALANVPRHMVSKLARVLRAHEICRPDGTVDPLAEQFVTAQVSTALKGKRR